MEPFKEADVLALTTFQFNALFLNGCLEVSLGHSIFVPTLLHMFKATRARLWSRVDLSRLSDMAASSMAHASVSIGRITSVALHI